MSEAIESRPNLLRRSIETLRRDGLMQAVRQSVLFLARRIAWRSRAWSKHCEEKFTLTQLYREYGNLTARNRIFRDCHKGRRCFVIGNGPSLATQDLSFLSNEITLVTNSFYLHPVISDRWQPTYYFLSDPAYFDSSIDPSVFKEITDQIRSTTFFVPHFAKDLVLDKGVLPAEQTYFVVTWGEFDEGKPPVEPDLTTSIPGMQTVVQFAILVAMYMGCSQIYLLGLDHDWLSHGGEHLTFSNSQKEGNQPSGNITGWNYRPLMEAVLVMWQIYEGIARLAEVKGIEIINVTRGGFLDVFPRGSYEDIVGNQITATAPTGRP